MKCVICGNEIETTEFGFLEENMVHNECKEARELEAKLE